MKRTLAIFVLGLVGLMTIAGRSAQLERHPQETTQTNEERRANAPRRAQAQGFTYQRRDTWYEFLLKQFNPNNVAYGARIEERRQVFLNEIVRNPYFKYSAGVTLALLLMTMACSKLWFDHRRTLWITAEMMADLYNHDLYSRDVAERAIRKYNDHIERCNRAIEASQHGSAIPDADQDLGSCKSELKRVTDERNEYLRQLNDLQATLKTKEQTVAELSLRVDGISMKSAGNGAAGPSVELNNADPNVVRHINNLQEQIYAERETNKRLKGA